MIEINIPILEMLVEIFSNTERPDKIKINLDRITRSISVTYENSDSEWFNELSVEVDALVASAAVKIEEVPNIIIINGHMYKLRENEMPQLVKLRKEGLK